MARLNKIKGHFLLSSDKRKLQYKFIVDFLSTTYWAKGIKKATLLKSLKNSHCYGLFHKKDQIGFARVVTDFSRNAYLADVFVLEGYQKKDLGKFMLKGILSDPAFDPQTKWILATRDAHQFYEKFGFQPLLQPKNYMQH